MLDVPRCSAPTPTLTVNDTQLPVGATVIAVCDVVEGGTVTL